MAEEKIIDLRDKVILYAPKGAKHHEEGEETQVSPTLVEHFKKHGYTTEKPKAKDAK